MVRIPSSVAENRRGKAQRGKAGKSRRTDDSPCLKNLSTLNAFPCLLLDEVESDVDDDSGELPPIPGLHPLGISLPTLARHVR